jgi:hypothetical protein
VASYSVEDGWCDPKKSGIGSHCFGDYFAPLTATGSNPWGNGLNPNPGLAMNIFRSMNNLAVISTQRISLIAWLLIIISCLSLPLFHFLKYSSNTSEQKILISTIYTLSMPVISVLDRGNIIALTVPSVYLFMVNLGGLKTRHKVALMFACLIKPQLIILSLLLTHRGRVKDLVKFVIIWIILFASSFLTFGDTWGNIQKYISGILDYSNYASRGKIYPVNLSLRNIFDITNQAIGGALSPSFIAILSITLLTIYGLLVISQFRNITSSDKNIYLALFLISFIGTSFSYYSIYLLLAFLSIFANFDTPEILKSKSQRFIFGGMFLFIFPLNSFSWKLIPSFQEYGQTQVSLSWTLGQLFMMAAVVNTIRTILRGMIRLKSSKFVIETK